MVEDERLLDGVQMEGRADALDGGDLRPVRQFLHLHRAGTDQLAVHDDIAAAALAGAAPDLGARQVELLAQDVRQAGLLIDDQSPFDAVDVDDLLSHGGLLGRRWG